MRPTFALGAAALPFAATAVSALQFPFHLPLFFGQSHSTPDTQPQAPLSLPDIAAPNPPRIAIIGAGAAGSASAFFIGKARERFGFDVEVDIYDKNDYIGGRKCNMRS